MLKQFCKRTNLSLLFNFLFFLPCKQKHRTLNPSEWAPRRFLRQEYFFTQAQWAFWSISWGQAQGTRSCLPLGSETGWKQRFAPHPGSVFHALKWYSWWICLHNAMFLKLPSNPGSQESCSTEMFCYFSRKSTFYKLLAVLHTEFSVLCHMGWCQPCQRKEKFRNWKEWGKKVWEETMKVSHGWAGSSVFAASWHTAPHLMWSESHPQLPVYPEFCFIRWSTVRWWRAGEGWALLSLHCHSALPGMVRTGRKLGFCIILTHGKGYRAQQGVTHCLTADIKLQDNKVNFFT